MEIAVVAFLDRIHELACIIFIVFIRNNLLPDTSTHYSYIYSLSLNSLHASCAYKVAVLKYIGNHISQP